MICTRSKLVPQGYKDYKKKKKKWAKKFGLWASSGRFFLLARRWKDIFTL